MFSGSPGLSGHRCLSIIRVAYTWNPTVCRDQQLYSSTTGVSIMDYNSPQNERAIGETNNTEINGGKKMKTST